MNRLFSAIVVFTFLCSCSGREDEGTLPSAFLGGKGVFIVNEGNFRMGNGSLSFFSYDSSKVFNDVFGRINNRILGDIPNSMKIYGGNAYIVVNNSGKIEVTDRNTMVSVKTIIDLKSPRHIAFADNQKAYVTSMYSDTVTIIDLRDNSVSGYVDVRRSTESIEIIGQKAYVANWVGGDEVMVINTVTNKAVDSIKVGSEPESMAVDRNDNLWVLCNGGWSGENDAELVMIDTHTNQISKRFLFPVRPANPSCLQANGRGDTLYFIQDGIKRISIGDNAIPSSSLIPAGTHSFYKIGIDPVNSSIFVTDAVDYQHKGFLLHYKPDGTLVSQYQTDINPGFMWFKN